MLLKIARWPAGFFFGGTLLLVAAVLTCAILLILAIRDSSLSNGERELKNAAFVLARQIEQSLKSVELVQQSLIERMHALGVDSAETFEQRLSGHDVHLMLRDKISGLPQLEALSLFDADGVLVTYSHGWPAPHVEMSDRDFSKVLKHADAAENYLDVPIRMDGSQYSTVHFARRFVSADGKFLGTVVGALSQKHFQDMFGAVSLGREAAISLHRSDGVLLARTPTLNGSIGRTGDEAEPGTGSAAPSSYSWGDLLGHTNSALVANERLTAFPVSVQVSHQVAVVLAEWRRAAIGILAASGVLIASVVLIFFFNGRNWVRQHRKSEQQIQDKEFILNTAVNNISQGLCMFDASARILAVNRRYLEMYNLSPSIVKPGCSLRDLVNHRAEVGLLRSNADNYLLDLQSSQARNKPLTNLLETTDGRFINAVNHPLPGGGWVTTHEDITGRRKAELEAIAALAKAEKVEAAARTAHARLIDALEAVPEGIALFDADDRFVHWNSRYTELYPNDVHTVGMKFEEFLKGRVARGLIPAARGREEEWLADRMRRHREPSQSEEQRLSDGRWVRIEERMTADGGRVTVRVDITDLKRREASFRLLFDGNPVPMWVYAKDSLKFLAVNDAAVSHYGYPRDTFLSMTILDIRPQEDWDDIRSRAKSHQETPEEGQPSRHIKADGKIIDVDIYARALTYEGTAAALIAAIDHTDRKKAEDELRSTREFLNTIVENVPVTIIVKDARDLRYLLINRAGEQLYGIPRDKMIGKTAFDIHTPETAKIVSDHDNQILRTGAELLLTENAFTTPDQKARMIDTKRLPVLDAAGRPQYLLTVSQDVTEKVSARARLEYISNHDSLTDLPNRRAFIDEVAARSSSPDAAPFAVICLDLDRFSDVSDTFGHEIGDAILVETAKRLRTVAGDGFLARVGGDEFSIVTSQDAQPAAAERISKAALTETLREYYVGDRHLRIGASIGIAIYPADGTSVAQLLANADAALNRAKSDGRRTIRFFDAAMDQQLRARRLLQQELETAISKGELSIEYQPQAKIHGAVIGFEALARWHHPVHGNISPSTFIPIAEECGLIVPMGEWILEEVCREAVRWPNPLQVAVNLSPAQFRHGDIAATVHKILLRTGLSAPRLELEITEGVLVEDFSKAISALRQIKSLGAKIAMDDFGTGYSSLSYLQAFPFDKIKIDKSFVADVHINHHSSMIVRTIIALARGLNLPVLAEGVEAGEQLKILSDAGCDEIQGYLLGMPGSIDGYAHLTGLDSKPGGRASSFG